MYIPCFPGRNGESCSGDNQCLPPQTCVNEKCTCPVNTTYATFYFAGVVDWEKCVPNNRKFFFAHTIITHDVMITNTPLLT